MHRLRPFRILLLALTVSLALHAAVMVGMPGRLDAIDKRGDAIYSATLEDDGASAAIEPRADPAPAPAAPRPAPRPRARPRPAKPAPEALAAEPIEPIAAVAAAEPLSFPVVEEPVIEPEPEKLAMAAPTVASTREPEPFPVDAIPADLSIDYRLTSSFAEGHATYRWLREGDSYRITGEAEAEGFFALFLEGQIVQETRGVVTAQGLQPQAFSEHKPGSPSEGLEFDWNAKTVVFDRNGTRKTAKLADNTVDWLSMIFQLAHRPPQGAATDMKVFTQRRMYEFRLQVLGVETIDIPLGRVKAMHLRHVDPQDKSEVDVWLGVDQYYVPVKMRYPVAKNRLTVEQVATRVSAR
jgi:hypothetical protein